MGYTRTSSSIAIGVRERIGSGQGRVGRTAIRAVQTFIEGDNSSIELGAQNCHWENEGAYTGEIAPPMLARLKCKYVIAGHSERRQYFGETDEIVNKKAKAIFANGMIPKVQTAIEALEQADDQAAHGMVVVVRRHESETQFPEMPLR